MNINTITALNAAEKIYLYNKAIELFDKGMSVVQIEDLYKEHYGDVGLLNEIIDKARYYSWHILYRDIKRLFNLNWNRHDVIEFLKGRERQVDIVELLTDELYNIQPEALRTEADTEFSMRWWPYALSFGLFNIWYSQYKHWSIYVTIISTAITIVGLLGLAITFKFFRKEVKAFDRVLHLEISKKLSMYNRLSLLFMRKKKRVLNVYCTAGYPKVESTIEVMKALQKAGADIIELGMPYSDPLADGPVIQASSAVALRNGMTLAKLFEQLKSLRQEISIPVVLMGYLNPLLQYGFEKFCQQCFESGIDGLIVPDIPMFEYEKEYAATVKKYGLDFIFLVTPETPNERIKKLDSLSTGFLYAVSSSSITGSDKDFGDVEIYLQKLRDMNLKNPILVGFGIKDNLTFDAATKHTAGAIIGTAYIKALENSENVEEDTIEFLEGIIKNPSPAEEGLT